MNIVPQLVANSLIAASLYTLIAASFNFVYTTTKFFNFAHGAVAAIGGYTVYYLTESFGLGSTLAVLLGVIIAGFIGFCLEKFVYQPLRRRHATRRVLLIASLGVLTVLQAILAILFTNQFQALGTTITGTPFTVFGGIVTRVQVWMLAAAVCTVVGLTILLRATTFGRAVRAISDDEEVAKIVGIDTDRIIGRVTFIGSAIVGLAGILVGFDTGLQPNMGLLLLLSGFVAAVIGGIGSVWGAALGALIVGVIENFGIWKLSGEWKSAIAFGLLIIFFIFRPQGLVKK